MIERRRFIGAIAGGLLAMPLAAEAQTAGKTARVGWLALGPKTGGSAAFFDAFREGLRERGWIDGRNLVIEARWGNRDQHAIRRLSSCNGSPMFWSPRARWCSEPGP
jgi:hypothetical protein